MFVPLCRWSRILSSGAQRIQHTRVRICKQPCQPSATGDSSRSVQSAGSSTEPCRFRFPDPVSEQVRLPSTIPIDALFVKWSSIDNGVADANIKRYNRKHNYIPASEPDPYEYPAFLEYAEAESNIRDAKEFEEYSRQLRQYQDHIPQGFQERAEEQVMARRIYECMDFESRSH
jgi:hypothetical protein